MPTKFHSRQTEYCT